MSLIHDYKEAKLLLDSGQIYEAQIIFKKLTLEYPNNESIWLWYARSLDDNQERVNLLEQALIENPDSDTITEYLERYKSILQHNTPPEAHTLVGKLEQARQQLLDLGMRNSLINYRVLKARGVQLTDCLPEQVYTLLVKEGKKLSFIPAPDPEEQSSEQQSTTQIPSTKRRRNAIQTVHFNDDLQKRLRNTYRAARTHVEEKGVNILYIALGMLHWYEADHSNVLRQAPLILVPVNINRTNVLSRFQITYSEGDIGDNLSLSAKLKQDFGIKLPQIPDTDDLDIPRYFQRVKSSVRREKQWSVDTNAVHLGFFSFNTFLMYNDLLEETWIESTEITKHPLLRSLLQDGFSETTPINDNIRFIDDIVDPESARHVVDADSSQIDTLLAINNGHNLVIQGPPGTGKSQTITNIIAEAIGQNKRVLFVAEKMAALEVVKRRLDNIGLGDACLELHSNKSSKRTVLNELQRTYNLGRPQTKSYAIDLELLKRNRDRLNQYSKIANTPIGISNTTPFQCYGYILQLEQFLSDSNPPSIKQKTMATWSEMNFHEHQEKVNDLQTILRKTGIPKEHPFWAVGLTQLPRATRRAIVEKCQQTNETISQLMESIRELTTHLDSPLAESRNQVQDLLDILEHLLNAPDVEGVMVTSLDWLSQNSEINTGIDFGEERASVRAEYNTVLTEDALTEDISEIDAVYKKYEEKWWRLVSKEFRKARKILAHKYLDRLPWKFSKQIETIKILVKYQNQSAWLNDKNEFLVNKFGEIWSSVESDWSYLRDITSWLKTLHQAVTEHKTHPNILTYVSSSINKDYLNSLLISIKELLNKHLSQITELFTEMELDEVIRFGSKDMFTNLLFTEQIRYIHDWEINVDRIQEMVSYNAIVSSLLSAKLDALVIVASEWSMAHEHLVHLYQRTWYENLLDIAYDQHPELVAFDGSTHSQCLEKFRELDQLQFQYNQARLAEQHWQRIPHNATNGQIGVLLKEFNKKSRHKPIRKLMEEAGNAIQTIKPVFMMSPLSIATYLPPDSVSFDLVVFDEASQVKPAHAFGAILRGDQVVVTGDNKQLPPTTFFEQTLNSDDDEDVENLTSDMESILGLFCGQGAPQKMLNWHYRSKHESLIAVSNYEFYENKLTVFPNPDDSRSYYGLVFHHLPDTYYDRGKSRTNPGEAQIVAERIMEHAQEYPYETLGVAAFSNAQAHAIEDQLENLRRNTPSCEEFFTNHVEEPFFIKNLENVQGDERDVIFISVGYGHDQNGSLTMSFGPLNRIGGERRLNVLITRARERCEVFSNLTSRDIDTSRTSSVGVSALKRYLEYAETGNLNIPESTYKKAESPFEEDVANALREQGFLVEHQVGAAGFRIDLAVKDSRQNGRYLLGIECDGATYHSARSARDRDRIRQQVLEGLGWEIHRIWSTDWFNHREQEINRLIKHIKAVEKKQPDSKPHKVKKNKSSHSINEPIQRIDVIESETSENTIKYIVASVNPFRSLYDVSASTFSRGITGIVQVESPIHIDEVCDRIKEAAIEGRLTAKVRAAIDRGIKLCVNRKEIVRRGNFLWLPNMTVPTVRDRSHLPSTSRKAERITTEEIAEAIILSINEALGLQKDEVVKATAAKLGIKRVTSDVKQKIESVTNRLMAISKLGERGQYIHVKNDTSE